jgi:sugar lactone lactonase YvrE
MDEDRAAAAVVGGDREGRRGALRQGARRLVLIAAAIGIIGAGGISLATRGIDAPDGAVLGTRPTYGPALTAAVPNLAAIDRMIWMPGLDSGWDPQGLAEAEGSLLLSAYRSDRFDKYRGPCRVFRLDPASGRETGHVDVPPPCGHAGGLAYGGDGRLYIADTRTLFAVGLDEAFSAAAPAFRSFPFGHDLGGGFAASGRGAVWIGTYSEERSGRIFEFRTATLAGLGDGEPLRTKLAATEFAVPSYAQGAAVDASGSLWIARGDLAWGYLEKLDPATGRRQARYPVPGGIQGIAFDRQGRLWAVSEAGSRHLPLRYPFFPLVFRIDPARLRSGGSDAVN